VYGVRDEAPAGDAEVIADCDYLGGSDFGRDKVAQDAELIIIDAIEPLILTIRRQKVMADRDLAKLYGTTTKAFNQAIKRNKRRFPMDFMFQLTSEEKQKVVTNCDHLRALKYSPQLPNVFTEHGALMAASILNTPRAIDVSVFVVRAFVRLRQLLASHAELARKVDALEKKYDTQFKVVFDAIRQLMTPPNEEKPKRRIGFGREHEV
jgi:hypothetical protein